MQAYSKFCVTLTYSELWYTQNPGIFKTRVIFRTPVYTKLRHVQSQRHVQKPGLFRILRYSEPKTYSEHCQTSTMKRFDKQLTAIIIFASYNYFCNIGAICKPPHWNSNWSQKWYYKRHYLHFHQAYGP